MVSYLLGKTVSENGAVTRGICQTNDDGYLQGIVEQTGIEKDGDGGRITTDDGQTTTLPGSTVVSMNFWGFTGAFIDHAKRMFPQFLEQALQTDAMKGEFYLPTAIGQLLEEKKAQVKVLKSSEQWFGVTFQEDKPMVVQSFARLTAEGVYPDNLWGN